VDQSDRQERSGPPASAAGDLVLDLRNWYEVEEYRVGPHGEEIQVNVFTGRDGGSGGEKERLAMLLAGAGIAYVFGGQDRARAAVGLNAIMIDEAFQRSSDDTALAATGILAALGPQVIGATPFSKASSLQPCTKRVFVISSLEGQASVRSVVFGPADENGAPTLIDANSGATILGDEAAAQSS
jgi:uncharacterized protein YPO0396